MKNEKAKKNQILFIKIDTKLTCECGFYLNSKPYQNKLSLRTSSSEEVSSRKFKYWNTQIEVPIPHYQLLQTATSKTLNPYFFCSIHRVSFKFPYFSRQLFVMQSFPHQILLRIVLVLIFRVSFPVQETETLDNFQVIGSWDLIRGRFLCW